MLLIFKNSTVSGSTPPILPDLHVKDSASGLDIPVGGIEGWDDDFLQTQTVTYAPQVFSASTVTTVDGFSDLYWCMRLSRIVISVGFSTPGASCTLFPLWIDKNGVRTIGADIPVASTTTQVNALYLAANVFAELHGAYQVKIGVRSISGGSVSIRLAGV